MLETIIGIFIAVLCVAGAASIIKWVAIRISSKGMEDKRIYAVILDGDEADIQLQMALETAEWDLALQDVRLYAVDCGIKAELREYCRSICKNSRFDFIDKERFSEKIFET